MMVGDEGSRRRLPSWMMGSTSRNSSTSNNGDHSESSNKASSSVAVECEAKRKRARKSSSTQQVSETVKEKRRVPRKKKFEPKSVGAESNGDGEGELSVEDLVSIAKEYVEADKDFGSEKQLLTASSEENESRSSYNAPESVQKSPTHRTTEVSNSTMNLTSEQSLLSPSGAGDPAKDMLDLFLGPLLKKPVQEEKKTEFITIGEGFSHEFRQKSQNDLGEKMVPPMKTKSSLKDKVAMFLD